VGVLSAFLSEVLHRRSCAPDGSRLDSRSVKYTSRRERATENTRVGRFMQGQVNVGISPGGSLDATVLDPSQQLLDWVAA
jgi:hypothetical protein